MIDTYIASRAARILEPEKVTVPATKAATVKALEVVAAAAAAEATRREVDATLTGIRNLGGNHLAKTYLADPFTVAPDPNSDLEAAERAARDAQTRVEGLGRAQALAWNDYTTAVDSERPAYCKSLAAKVPPTLTKMTTAVRLLEAAQVELGDYLDMLEGVSSGGYTAKMVGPGTYAIPLSQAVDSARQALAAAQAQLEAAKAATS